MLTNLVGASALVGAMVSMHLSFVSWAGDPPSACPERLKLKVPQDPCYFDPEKCDPAPMKAATESKLDWTNAIGTDFVADRRPGYIITLHNGEACSEYGLVPYWNDCDNDGCAMWFWTACSCQSANCEDGWDETSPAIPDAIDNLLWRLEAAYDAGFRRIMLNRPAGSVGNTVSMSQWWTIPEWKRDWLVSNDGLKGWICNHTDCDVGIYIGYTFKNMEGDNDGDPCTLELGENTVDPDNANPNEMEIVKQNLQPWIDIGIKFVCFDYTAGADQLITGCGTTVFADSITEHMLALQQSPDYLGILKFMGEQYPADLFGCPSPTHYIPDAALIEEGAYFSSVGGWNGFAGINPNNAGTFINGWDFSADNVEAGMVFGMESPISGWGAITIESIQRLKDMGYTPWVYETIKFHNCDALHVNEFIYRVYDFGDVCRADFNGDGCVNSTDVSAFNAQYAIYAGIGTTFWEGDVNGNNVINSTDASDFVNAYLAVNGSNSAVYDSACGVWTCSYNCSGYTQVLP